MKPEPLRKRIVVIVAMALGFSALAFLPVAFADDKNKGGDQYGFGGYRGDGDHQWVGTWATSPQATNVFFIHQCPATQRDSP